MRFTLFSLWLKLAGQFLR